MNADPIVIEDSDYALWYRDMSEEMEKYSGKTVRFKALIAKNARMPDNMFVAGRHVMTCCVQDIQYSGLVCKWLDANKLKNRTWGMVTAKIELRFSKFYGRKGPVLNIISVEPAEKPEQEVATFY